MYTHVFALMYILLVILQFYLDSCDEFIHILQGYFVHTVQAFEQIAKGSRKLDTHELCA